MEVCRSRGRDETLQAHIITASGKSFHHQLLWAGLMLTQQLATAFSGSTLRNSTWLENHTILIFAPLGALHHGLGESLERKLLWKPQGQSQVGAIPMWEQERESWSGSHTSSAAGAELCGSHEDFRRTIDWYICWCAKMLTGASRYAVVLISWFSCPKSESGICCMLRTPRVRKWEASALQVRSWSVGRAAAPPITGEGRREERPSAAPPACPQYKTGAQIFYITIEKLPSSSRRTWLKSFSALLLLNLPVVHS